MPNGSFLQGVGQVPSLKLLNHPAGSPAIDLVVFYPTCELGPICRLAATR